MNGRMPLFPSDIAGEHPLPDRFGVNAYTDDPEFASLLALYLPEALFIHLKPHLHRLGEIVGNKLDLLARTSDQNPPVLEHRSRTGIDIQQIRKHPSFTEMEQIAFGEFGLAAMSHRGGVLGWPKPMPASAKYALTYLFVQSEFGLCCPVSMTDSLTRTLTKYGRPELVQRYLNALTTQDLDLLCQGSMFMTEQGAGSDVAATSTQAVPDETEPGQTWRLHGDKWFCSNPDAELAMVLARTQGAGQGIKGVSLFLMPRTLPDGTLNHYRIIRLKDKLGSRSMASGEIRLEGARAWLVGELGSGFHQMADMINNSRLSNGVRAAGLMRRAVAEAIYFSRHRIAFDRHLIRMPLMQRQLAKMIVPAEQARTLMFQSAEALRRSDHGNGDAYKLARLLTPLIKFRACRDARKVTGDAMEVRGGCGYIEEWSDPRLLRDAHLGSIWEGTSNIVALDVMRAIKREVALPVWRIHLEELLAQTPWHFHVNAKLQMLLNKVEDQARETAQRMEEAMARQVASAMYHLTSAIAMGWEAGKTGSLRRMLLAQLVLIHRVLPQDPLGKTPSADLEPLFEVVATPASAEKLRQLNILT